MRNFIPNLLTICNLLCGCFGVVWAFTNDLRLASLAILGSLVFDYADGFAARLLNARSAIGKELDSLADLISFGLVPAVIAYILMRANNPEYLAYFPFLITAFSALRLAKFNIDERQAENFIGLPTPANAIFWASFPLIILNPADTFWKTNMAEFMSNESVMAVFILITSYLLIAELPLFSLKFKSAALAPNKHRYLFLLMSLVLLILLQYHGIPFIILLYLLISFIYHKTSGKYEIQG